jgi:uncharacterized protein
MMQINLLDLSEAEGRSETFQFIWPTDEIRFRTGTFPVLDKGSLQLTMTNTGRKVLVLQGEGHVTVGIPCDRCLTVTRREIAFSFERKIDLKLPPEELAEELDENSYLNGTELETDQLFFLELLLNWPHKTLCRPDCKGLCSRCGKNLNEGSCGCEDPEPDPRMARIRDIFNNASIQK